jgi:L-amino acid N-acyltransferase YncA
MAAVAALYAHHVRSGIATFEEIPPAEAEMKTRLQAVRDLGTPWLVAERDGKLLGYAYASLYRTRSAYRFVLEDSIYVAPDAAGQGIGGALLDRLLVECSALGYRQMIAVIGDSGNVASIAIHRSRGFADAGVLKSVGFKFGRWIDSVFMQRALGEGDDTLPQASPRRP